MLLSCFAYISKADFHTTIPAGPPKIRSSLIIEANAMEGEEDEEMRRRACVIDASRHGPIRMLPSWVDEGHGGCNKLIVNSDAKKQR